ncbi:SDR family NAD(P)-dependent oxidoreductase [Bdellovibrio bacteriovorus]|uniref:SDR family NAD(P)-dependent oxidoreductase n=1 Tax=Bdellovibrio bacteriovorus TaxID=959 RepID=UPI0035A739A0
MDLFIVTGGSKGLGEQVCLQALERGHSVINLSRSRPSIKSSRFKHIAADFSRGLKMIQRVESVLKKLDVTAFRKIHLINNAALISPVGSLVDLDPAEMNAHLITNLISPLLLSQVCAHKAMADKKPLTIFNIGSGASFRPIPGWSMYCSSKAGLKMFTESTDLDLQKSKNKKIKIYHFSPGVLDTQMQQTIRGFKKKDFPDVANFKKMKADHQLRAPSDVASLVVRFCLTPQMAKNYSCLISVQDLEGTLK